MKCANAKTGEIAYEVLIGKLWDLVLLAGMSSRDTILSFSRSDLVIRDLYTV